MARLGHGHREQVKLAQKRQGFHIHKGIKRLKIGLNPKIKAAQKIKAEARVVGKMSRTAHQNRPLKAKGQTGATASLMVGVIQKQEAIPHNTVLGRVGVSHTAIWMVIAAASQTTGVPVKVIRVEVTSRIALAARVVAHEVKVVAVLRVLLRENSEATGPVKARPSAQGLVEVLGSSDTGIWPLYQLR